MPRSSASVRACGLDLLRGEDTTHRGEQRIAVEQLEVSRQLLDAVDLAAALDLHRHGQPVRIASHDVDRADCSRVLAAHEPIAVAEGVDVLGEQLLQMRLDAVLHQAGIDAEFVRRVVQHLVDGDHELLAGLVVTVQICSRAASVHGGLIQFSGL